MAIEHSKFYNRDVAREGLREYPNLLTFYNADDGSIDAEQMLNNLGDQRSSYLSHRTMSAAIRELEAQVRAARDAEGQEVRHG